MERVEQAERAGRTEGCTVAARPQRVAGSVRGAITLPGDRPRDRQPFRGGVSVPECSSSSQCCCTPTTSAGSALDRFDAFQQPGFDLGIFDQGVWLLSRFKAPFVSIMGLNLFGDHASYILLALVPLYWLWPAAQALLIAQTLALCLGAIPGIPPCSQGAAQPVDGPASRTRVPAESGAWAGSISRTSTRTASRSLSCSSPFT